MIRSRSAGFALIALLLAVVALELGVLAAAPVATTARRRVEEAELKFRLRAYKRGIDRFRSHFGRAPLALEELLTLPPNPRMIRALYPDPTTASGKWSIMRQPGDQSLVNVRSTSRDRALDGSNLGDWHYDENNRFIDVPDSVETPPPPAP